MRTKSPVIALHIFISQMYLFGRYHILLDLTISIIMHICYKETNDTIVEDLLQLCNYLS